MTVLEWMKASTRFNFEDITFKKIAIDREINDTADVTTLNVRDKELLEADMILSAFVFSPSTTASESVSHNNFQHTRGSEGKPSTMSLNWAKAIYTKYNDENLNYMTDSEVKPITRVNLDNIL